MATVAHCDPEPAPPTPTAGRRHTGTARIALVGNPNTGKTTIFNRLCGTRAKTANFPGTTTTMRVGRCRLADDHSIEIIDLPGIYQMTLDSPEVREVANLLRGANERQRLSAIV